MQCPTCDGQTNVKALINTGEDHAKHRQGRVVCPICHGTGVVDAEYTKRLANGTAFRRARTDRGELLGVCAKRFGVSTSTLSAYENGLPVDDADLAKIVRSN